MREQALILRLVAAELQHEQRSVIALRRILIGDLGWDARRLDEKVAVIHAAAVGLYRQSELFERAA